MKLITDNAAYVKKYDLAYIGKMRRLKNEIPESIVSRIPYEVDKEGLLRDRYEFVKFNSKEEIEYFKNIQDILDYKHILSKDIAQISDLLCEYYAVSRTNSIYDSKLNSDERLAIIDFARYTSDDLNEIYIAKQRALNIELPEEIDVKVK